MSRGLILTPHAVERYRERWAPELSVPAAREQLTDLAAGAAPIKAKTILGDEQWASGDLRFVVKRDGDGKPPVCVTVLGPRIARDENENVDAYGDPLASTSELIEAREANRIAKQHLADVVTRMGELKAEHTQATDAYAASRARLKAASQANGVPV